MFNNLRTSACVQIILVVLTAQVISGCNAKTHWYGQPFQRIKTGGPADLATICSERWAEEGKVVVKKADLGYPDYRKGFNLYQAHCMDSKNKLQPRAGTRHQSYRVLQRGCWFGSEVLQHTNHSPKCIK